ncbi:thiosulfate/3-mercaptopyruvate sulfurtransferase [Propionibacterium cyclohexanicum]|uniref:Thiosulfate/3-mercaptopyruvate sulfurtransferase n=1 Tax=Propionibacterium cyclohexanicum TaxID=64702 RepID=A0A1H9TZZ0_9ACTN|nr:sulfurtransferase [Propionibacterium cyclohexanicum]SES02464.1 thiosulfate/3-mercaptopyruvate sulfurtransferase [Propionibacterium cyclohexanicum]
MTLITPVELAGMLASATPPAVLDVRWSGPAAPGGGREDFEAGHVPGSQWISADDELSDRSKPGGRHPLPSRESFQTVLREHGVRRDRPVVVLDARDSQAAGRLWWMLTDAGLTDVHVLDGGFAAWQAAGLPVQAGPAEPVAPGDVVVGPPSLPTADADEVARASRNIWDVRAPERFRGDREPIDPRAGHIPGARNLPEQDNHRRDGRFKSVEELQRNLAQVRPGDIVYCGSGITAAQTLLALHIAGIDGVRLYPGSWSDWSGDPARPVALG